MATPVTISSGQISGFTNSTSFVVGKVVTTAGPNNRSYSNVNIIPLIIGQFLDTSTGQSRVINVLFHFAITPSGRLYLSSDFGIGSSSPYTFDTVSNHATINGHIFSTSGSPVSISFSVTNTGASVTDVALKSIFSGVSGKYVLGLTTSGFDLPGDGYSAPLTAQGINPSAVSDLYSGTPYTGFDSLYYFYETYSHYIETYQGSGLYTMDASQSQSTNIVLSTSITMNNLAIYFVPTNCFLASNPTQSTPTLPILNSSIVDNSSGIFTAFTSSLEATSGFVYNYCRASKYCGDTNCFGGCTTGTCTLNSASTGFYCAGGLAPGDVPGAGKMQSQDFISVPNPASFVRGKFFGIGGNIGVPQQQGALQGVIPLIIGKIVVNNRSRYVPYFLQVSDTGQYYLCTDFRYNNLTDHFLSWYSENPQIINVKSTTANNFVFPSLDVDSSNRLIGTSIFLGGTTGLNLKLTPCGNLNIPSDGLYTGVPYKLASDSPNATTRYYYEYLDPNVSGSNYAQTRFTDLYSIDFQQYTTAASIPNRIIALSPDGVGLKDLVFYFLPQEYYSPGVAAITAGNRSACPIYDPIAISITGYAVGFSSDFAGFAGFLRIEDVGNTVLYNYCTGTTHCSTCLGSCTLDYQSCVSAAVTSGLAGSNGFQCIGDAPSDTGTGTGSSSGTGTGSSSGTGTGSSSGTGTGTGSSSGTGTGSGGLDIGQFFNTYKTYFIIAGALLLVIIVVIIAIVVLKKKPQPQTIISDIVDQ